MAGPFSPEEEASIYGYWGGVPAPTAAAPPPMPPAHPLPPVIELDEPPLPPAMPPPAAGPASMFGVPGAGAAQPPPMPPAHPLPPEDAKARAYFGGPSAQDNREFEAFKASQAQPKPAAPTGPSKPANPDPYGIKGAGDRMVGSFDAQAAATRQIGEGEAAKSEAIGGTTIELARRKFEDAELDLKEQDDAAKHLDSTMSEVARQIDDVRTQKVRPIHAMDEGPATGMMSILGGIFGGIYQAVSGARENPFLAEMNRMIDRQIAIDEKNLDRAATGLGQKMNLLQQQRALLHDTHASKLAARNLYYEAFKDQIVGEAAQYDSPIYKARAEESLSHIRREQSGLQRQLGKELQGAAAAAAARGMAQRREVIAAYRETYDKALAAGLSPAQAEYEANRMIGVLYAPGSMGARAPAQGGRDPLAAVPKQQQTEAQKELAAYGTAQSAINALRQQFTNWEKVGVTSPRQQASIKGTIAGLYKGALGPGMSSDKDFEAFIEPNVPAVGEGAETLALKRRNIEAVIQGKVATPILDTHNPGWKPKTRDETDAELGARRMP